MTSAIPEPGTGVWGDESAGVRAVLDWAGHRIGHPPDPHSRAKPAAELGALLGATITPAGIGADRALTLFTDVLVPATRAQDDPMNLAYVPSAPTRSAAAFELATSASNIFAGLWEGGAGRSTPRTRSSGGWPACSAGPRPPAAASSPGARSATCQPWWRPGTPPSRRASRPGSTPYRRVAGRSPAPRTPIPRSVPTPGSWGSVSSRCRATNAVGSPEPRSPRR